MAKLKGQKQDSSALLRGLETGASHAKAAASDVTDARAAMAERARIAADLGQSGAPATPVQAPSAATLSENALIEVPIALIDDNPYDSCPIKDEQLIAVLAESIKEKGQKMPAMVVPSSAIGGSPDRWIMVEGHHRKEALLRLDRKTIKAITVPEVATPRDLFEVSLIVNDQRRKDNPAIVNAKAWAKVLADGLYTTEQQLAARNSLDRSTVNRTLALLKLPEPAVKRLLDRPKRVGVRLGYAMFQYFSSFGQDKLLELCDAVFADDSKVTAESVEKLVSLGQPEKTKLSKKNSRKFKVTLGAAAPIGSLRHWDHNGRILVDVSVVDGEQQETLLRKLKDVLGIPNV